MIRPVVRQALYCKEFNESPWGFGKTIMALFLSMCKGIYSNYSLPT